MEGEIKNEKLPPGFRFHPTDEELISYYLLNRISDASFTSRAVADVDLNKSEPWELPGKAKMGEKEWYFFSLRDRKYPTGVRTNRATNTGYWKTTGKDKEIFNCTTVTAITNNSELVGMKKTLVFYRGRAPRGEKTNWVMHEYRIHSKSFFRTAKDEWVVCRVFQKNSGPRKYPSSTQSRTTSSSIHNPYNNNLENNLPANYGHPQMIQQPPLLDHQFPIPRNYMMTNAEISELARTLIREPQIMQQPSSVQMNYPPIPMQCFTISGVNLNLRGASTTPPQQVLRMPGQQFPMNQHEAASSAMFNGGGESTIGGYGGGGGEVNNNGNNFNNCMDFDNYWPGY